jgi:hypothetical protein
MKGAFPSGQTLHNQPCILINQDCHNCSLL